MAMINAKRILPGLKCHFTYAAPLEMLFSLNVLADPSSHPSSREWGKRKYAALSDSLREEIDFFSRNYANWFFITDVAIELMSSRQTEDCTVEEMFRWIEEMDDRDFAYISLGLSAFGYSRDMLNRWFSDPDSVTEAEMGVQSRFLSRDSIIYMLKNLDPIKKRITCVLRRYWEESFSQEWERIGPYEQAVAARERVVFQHSDPIEYIRSLHPNIKVENGRIILMKNPDFSISIDSLTTLVINLSVFTEPYLGGNIVDDKLFITMNLNYHSVKMSEPIPELLSAVLSALNDETRLRIIKILWNGEATTKELSEILELSPSAISIHLKALRESDLVRGNKVGKFVYYTLVKEPFQRISGILSDYLEY